jgi:hypothetical protein
MFMPAVSGGHAVRCRMGVGSPPIANTTEISQPQTHSVMPTAGAVLEVVKAGLKGPSG